MRGFPGNRRHQLCVSLAVGSLILVALYWAQVPSFGVSRPVEVPRPASKFIPQHPVASATSKPQEQTPPSASPSPPPSPARNPSRALVIAALQSEDPSWAHDLAAHDPNLTAAVYTVDNGTAPLTVPKNKGHEAMVYLTYLIDHYDHLPDIVIFMHAHLITWHNNDFLDANSATTITHLRSDKVLRDGYMNLRCHHEPGCPDHIHPTLAGDDLLNVPEAGVMGKSWSQLFPNTPIPEVLSQPCCGQFAVSGERLATIPRETYIFFRHWLLESPLDDKISGRVWEYLWQYIFAGVEEFCPDEYTCYCEGYGVCFGGRREEYARYFEIRGKSRELEAEMKKLEDGDGKVLAGKEAQMEEVKGKWSALRKVLDEIKGIAMER
ncbi:hypothetical protein FQN51_008998 [Onygenales sp. PD_10]|nr:hypothetical protein FQN51_008998 [Onygenales sp. PD_10]